MIINFEVNTLTINEKLVKKLAVLEEKGEYIDYDSEEDEEDELTEEYDAAETFEEQKEVYKKIIEKYYNPPTFEVVEKEEIIYPTGYLKKEYMSHSELIASVAYHSGHGLLFNYFSEIAEEDSDKIKQYINYLILDYFEEHYSDKDNFLIDSLDTLDGDESVSFVLDEYPNIFFHLMENFEMSCLYEPSSLVDRRRTAIDKAGKDKGFYTKFRKDYFYDLNIMDMSERYTLHDDFYIEEDSFLVKIRNYDEINIDSVVSVLKTFSLEERDILVERLVDCFNDYTVGKSEYTTLSPAESYLTRCYGLTGYINDIVLSSDEYLMTVVNGYFSDIESYSSKKLNHKFETDHLAFQYTKENKNKNA